MPNASCSPIVLVDRLAIRIACCALAVFAARPARAQFGTEHVILPQGPWIQGVHAADLDGDGDTDVLVCRRFGSPALAWFENLGGGSFGPERSLIVAQPYYAYQAATIDIDGDGDLDVIALVDDYVPQTGTDVRITLYTNLGGGNFGNSAELVEGDNSVRTFTLADVDGDGRRDLVYSTFGRVVWKHNTDPGFDFDQNLVTDPTTTAVAIAIADIDGDGHNDLLAARYPNEIAWYRNVSGTGGPFGPKIVIDPNATGALGVSAADLDGDGDVDVLSSSATSGVNWRVARYENLGGGALSPPQVFATATASATVLVTADLDGDGDVEIVRAGGAAWYPNYGAGAFGPSLTIGGGLVASGNGLAIADVDGDRDLDVVIGDQSGKLVWVSNELIEPIGTSYCGPAVPNSTGFPGTISALGNNVVAIDKVRVTASSLPPNKTTLFLASTNQGLVHNLGGGAGTLCLGSPLKRIQPAQNSGAGGTVALDLELASSLGTPILAGSTWNFQAWHRDVGTTNLTDAIQVVFAP